MRDTLLVTTGGVSSNTDDSSSVVGVDLVRMNVVRQYKVGNKPSFIFQTPEHPRKAKSD